MVYTDQQHKTQATIFRKPTDQQIYLHVQSNHPNSLKDSIPYSQPLRIKTISSTNCECNKNNVTLLQKDSKKKLTRRIW